MSHKNNDKQGRFRSKVIAFRVSPEENRVLERKVFLSGLTKQRNLGANYNFRDDPKTQRKE